MSFMTPDDFLIQLVMAGNSNIFQYLAVNLTLIIALLGILFILFSKETGEQQYIVTIIIYIGFSIIIAFSSMAIFNVMGAQNRWINELDNSPKSIANNTIIKNFYFESKGISSIFVNNEGSYTGWGVLTLYFIFIILIATLIYALYYNENLQSIPNIIRSSCEE